MACIILVEDEEAHREIIERAFARAASANRDGEAARIVAFDSIAAAARYLAEAGELDVQAVVADWNLPDGLGMDLLRESGGRFPFLLMTSFGNEALAVEALKAGAMDYIVKSPEEFRRMPATVQRITREWRNIVSRRRAESALKEREEQLSALLNNAAEPIWSLNREYRLLTFNNAFRNVISMMTKRQVSVGDCLLDYFPFDDPDDDRAVFWKTCYDRALQSRAQFIVERRETFNSAVMYAEMSFNPIIAATGEVTGVAVFSRDVTERKRAEEELRRREERLNAALEEKNRLLTELEQQKRYTIHAVVEGQEHERSRIARELHDGVGQMLSAVKIGLSSAQETVVALAPECAAQLRESIALLDKSVQEVRSVSHQLMPFALHQLGLRAAVRDIFTTLQAANSLRINATLDALAEPIGPLKALTIYRIVQELLNNTLKYGEATNASVQFVREPDSLLLMYEDDGRGFDAEAHRNDNAPQGIGLNNIAHRVSMLGGTVEIYSTPGKGMAATIEIPMTSFEMADEKPFAPKEH
jgi:PAS domain S-box-containing protein